MADRKEWSGEERRKILERRKDERAHPERRKVDRRREQICFVCHAAFVPAASGEIICEKCQLEGTRGGRRGERERPPF